MNSDTHSILQCLVAFLTPRCLRAVCVTSCEHSRIVQHIGSRDSIYRAQIHRIVQQHITTPADAVHDWDLTHTLLTTSPSALYYTGTELDTAVARAMQVTDFSQKYEVDTVAAAMLDVVQDGYTAAFCVWEASERYRMTREDYNTFLQGALMSHCYDILALPAMLQRLSRVSACTVESYLVTICDYTVPPRMIDLFLHNAPLAGVDCDPFLCRIISQGVIGAVKVALQHNLVPFGDDMHCYNPLCTAIHYNHVNIMRLLIADPRCTDIDIGSEVLDRPVKYGHVESARLLLDKYPTSTDHSLALCSAAECGRLEMVQLLLSYPATHIYSRAVRQATCNGHTEIALLLLSNRERFLGSLDHRALLDDALFAGDADVICAVRSLQT